jgi:hypothetical protein
VDPQYARAVLEEVQRRSSVIRRMLEDCLPQQRAAIADPSRLKALFCTRRAGKSWTLGVYLFLTALQHPGCSCLYLGLTKGSALGIMDKDILRVINRRYELGAEWRESKQRWELPNGSYIYLRGADANSYEISKVVGQKYRLAVLDEASKYRYVVADMVYRDLLPAMGDDYGTILLSGTPSNITTGLFYDATTGVAPGWGVHSWKWWENTYARDNIQRLHDETLAKNPAYRDTPAYRQEWLGEWVIDDNVLVYKYRDDINTAPSCVLANDSAYVLGVDLGFSDPSALVVGVYSAHDPCLYIVYACKRAGLTISDVAEWIRGLQQRWPFAAMVADASALQGVEEMRQRHNLPLGPPDRTHQGAPRGHGHHRGVAHAHLGRAQAGGQPAPVGGASGL